MFIKPNWPAPDNIRSLCTTREGGVSLPPFESLNLATHVGDHLARVEQNRHILVDQAGLPDAPFWLEQQHTVDAINLDELSSEDWQPAIADASWTTQANKISVVMTADCIPILITNYTGSFVCAIHAGWKGLVDGIVSKTIHALPEQPQNLMAWIGPCIRQANFEVGTDVFDLFIDANHENSRFFKHLKTQSDVKYLADLPGLLSFELQNLGVTAVYDSGVCTFTDQDRLYSYRRDGQTGRIASMIWITDE